MFIFLTLSFHLKIQYTFFFFFYKFIFSIDKNFLNAHTIIKFKTFLLLYYYITLTKTLSFFLPLSLSVFQKIGFPSFVLEALIFFHSDFI